VVTAINGRDALQKIPDVNPDLIVTDVMMPEMDGFTFAQKLKANKEFRYLPVIFVTAKATEEDRLHGLSIGVDDYIIKPFNPQELKIRINNLIANKLERQVWQDHASEEKEETLSADQELLNSIAVTVKKNMSNSDYTVEQLSHEVQLSSRQLYRKLKQLTGFTPAAYMRELRLQEARKLLEQHSHQTVSEIMYIVGFNHISYFSNLYEERFGRRPAEYFD
jgi:DNA-binding response OmpR family regulator